MDYEIEDKTKVTIDGIIEDVARRSINTTRTQDLYSFSQIYNRDASNWDNTRLMSIAIPPQSYTFVSPRGNPQLIAPRQSYNSEWEFVGPYIDNLVEQSVQQIKDSLLDPNQVHIMMLRGIIAKPSVDQIKHIYINKL